jgi:ribosomal protein S18 acetylase RimI-like enzyme
VPAASPLAIRRMKDAELGLALDWAAAEGWNPGLDDAAPFFAADPDGFLVGEVEGRPVATISLVRYGAAFGFLGFYIVHPEHRGQGYGRAMWRAAMALGEGRNIALDGVVAQQPNYRRSGFVYAYANERHEGIGGGTAPAGLTPIAAVPFDVLDAYDARMFGCARTTFLKSWIAQPHAAGLARVQDGALSGFGVIRQCRCGFKIGPLFADDATSAELLFDGLAARCPSAPIFLDVPRPNAAALALVRARNMHAVFETARMYTQGDPGIPVSHVFGVTSFELG